MPKTETGGMVPSDYDRAHVGEILRGHGTWYGAHLLRLVSLADAQERERLRSIYPEHVAAWEAYNAGGIA